MEKIFMVDLEFEEYQEACELEVTLSDDLQMLYGIIRNMMAQAPLGCRVRSINTGAFPAYKCSDYLLEEDGWSKHQVTVSHTHLVMSFINRHDGQVVACVINDLEEYSNER